MKKSHNISNANQEKKQNNFICCNCNELVEFSSTLGTAHRNHCPKCLFSLHLDKKSSGDRSAFCGGRMAPVGLTFKQEGLDKYGREKEGELMLIHKCSKCERVSINRLAADDDERAILMLFNESVMIDDKIKKDIINEGIAIATADDKQKIFIQLFGKSLNKVNMA